MKDLYRGDGGPLNDLDQGWNEGVDAAEKALRAEVEGMREDAERYLLERKGEDIWLHVNADGFRASINLGHRGAGNFFQRGLEACADKDAARKEAK